MTKKFNETVSKTIQIFILDQHQKNEIKNKLEQALINKGYDDNELDEIISNALDSRLCDLADTIDIYNLDTVKLTDDYDYKALRYAEIYGVIDYNVQDNEMIYKEVYPTEGTYKVIVNLDTFKETRKKIK